MRAGDFAFDHTGLTFQGQPVKLTPHERELVGALMHARGSIVSHDAILNRLGSDAMPGIISVHATNARRALRVSGAPDPIKAVYGQGLRWAGPAPVVS